MKNCTEAQTLFEKGNILSSSCEKIAEIPYPSKDIHGFQGGCSDWQRYYYLIMMHYDFESGQEENYSKIAKIDLENGEVIKWSDELKLYHANDITFNPKENILVVSNNKPHKNQLTVIDSDSLEYIRTVELPFEVYSIEFNVKRKCYVVGLSGTFDFCLLDESFALINERIYKGTTLTSRYTKQGVGADDELIYFILWDGKHKKMDDFQNEISVYDWKGNFLGVIEFDVGVSEPENISIVNGEILAVCDYNDTPTIFKIIPKLKVEI